MNIENITSLSNQLQSLGFENTSSSLLKRICFRPDNFILIELMKKGNDQISFHLYFEKSGKESAYMLLYYDAIIQKETSLTDTSINGISTIELEKRMAEIDWKTAFEFDTKKQWSTTDKASWEKEQKIESIIEQMEQLERTEDGKTFASGLKFKYWAGIPNHELIGVISPIKNKSEISQRFYFFEGQEGISADEAYRFLQNRWLEKQLQAKKKFNDIAKIEETEDDSKASSGNGLLKKNRFGSTKGSNKNKKVHN